MTKLIRKVIWIARKSNQLAKPIASINLVGDRNQFLKHMDNPYLNQKYVFYWKDFTGSGFSNEPEEDSLVQTL